MIKKLVIWDWSTHYNLVNIKNEFISLVGLSEEKYNNSVVYHIK